MTESNPTIGYKLAEGGLIIKLEIQGTNNQNRKDILDPKNAKYRCSQAKVLDIYDPHTQKKTASAHTWTPAKGKTPAEKFYYTLEEIITIPDFNPNLDQVCTTGIHYFLSEERAIYYKTNEIRDGTLYKFNDNGSPYTSTEYVNGQKHGKSIWYTDGVINCTITYHKDRETSCEYAKKINP